VKSALSEVEFIRIWAHEVPEYEAQGWRLRCVRQGGPCEAVLGPGYADCLMSRTLTQAQSAESLAATDEVGQLKPDTGVADDG